MSRRLSRETEVQLTDSFNITGDNNAILRIIVCLGSFLCR